ncbi:hypothetical protein BH11BAC1_BH11BAC1_27010 [soil metagenome]
MNLVNFLILGVCAISLGVVFYNTFKSSANKGAK